MSLKVNMDMVAAALQIRACAMAVSMPVPTSVVLYEGCPLLVRPCPLPTVQDKPLQYEDGEEAGSHDEFWEGKIALFETNTKRKSRIRTQRL